MLPYSWRNKLDGNSCYWPFERNHVRWTPRLAVFRVQRARSCIHTTPACTADRAQDLLGRRTAKIPAWYPFISCTRFRLIITTEQNCLCSGMRFELCQYYPQASRHRKVKSVKTLSYFAPRFSLARCVEYCCTGNNFCYQEPIDTLQHGAISPHLTNHRSLHLQK